MIDLYGWHLTSELLNLAASGENNKYTASDGSYAANLLKNDKGLNKFINDKIWEYGTSQGNSQPDIPSLTYEIPLNSGDLGAALHHVQVDIDAKLNQAGEWEAAVTIRDTFDFTEKRNPFTQDSVWKGLLWAANDIAAIDTDWGLLDAVDVEITYNKKF